MPDRPTITLIAAMSENRVIGAAGDLPWRLPADLKHFKALTTGHAILMGRKTYESIGKPLPNRRNLVLTGNPPGVETVRDIDEALRLVKDDDALFIIGGERVYRDTLPRADRLHLTLVHAHIEGDAHFPPFDASQWTLVDEQHRDADDRNAYALTFQHYERRR